MLKQIQSTRRPVVLTQHGRGAAVLLALDRYEALMEELEVLRDIRAAEEEIAAGKGLAQTKARARVLKRLRG